MMINQWHNPLYQDILKQIRNSKYQKIFPLKSANYHYITQCHSRKRKQFLQTLWPTLYTSLKGQELAKSIIQDEKKIIWKNKDNQANNITRYILIPIVTITANQRLFITYPKKEIGYLLRQMINTLYNPKHNKNLVITIHLTINKFLHKNKEDDDSHAHLTIKVINPKNNNEYKHKHNKHIFLNNINKTSNLLSYLLDSFIDDIYKFCNEITVISSQKKIVRQIQPISQKSNKDHTKTPKMIQTSNHTSLLSDTNKKCLLNKASKKPDGLIAPFWDSSDPISIPTTKGKYLPQQRNHPQSCYILSVLQIILYLSFFLLIEFILENRFNENNLSLANDSMPDKKIVRPSYHPCPPKLILPPDIRIQLQKDCINKNEQIIPTLSNYWITACEWLYLGHINLILCATSHADTQLTMETKRYLMQREKIKNKKILCIEKQTVPIRIASPNRVNHDLFYDHNFNCTLTLFHPSSQPSDQQTTLDLKFINLPHLPSLNG